MQSIHTQIDHAIDRGSRMGPFSIVHHIVPPEQIFFISLSQTVAFRDLHAFLFFRLPVRLALLSLDISVSQNGIFYLS